MNENKQIRAQLTSSVSPARAAAFAVLEAVHEGGYAADGLLLECAGLSSRDAGLASQIVFGVLRFQAQLDFLVQHYSGKRIRDLDTPVTLALRSAIFQVRYLERVPPHAAVHESVEYVKKRKRAASGLVNAVLRKVNREEVAWPTESVELSCPDWLLARWKGHFGAEQGRAIARAALDQPRSYVRLPGMPPDDLQLEPTDVPGCYELHSPAPEGLRLHDIGSQAIIPLLDLRPGQTYLDLCSAPGNKTKQALEANPKLAVACDISLKRLRTVPADCSRVVLDASAPLPFRGTFDRVFVDAPCSGTGTIARNPEIKWRVQIQDFGRFRHKQVQILRRAADAIAPGGKLVYATCSLEREENEDVVEAVLRAVPELKRLSETWRLPGKDPGDGFYAATLARIT